MNEFLKLAYDYGQQLAIKEAASPGFFAKAMKHWAAPAVRSGAGMGAASGALSGYLNAEEGHGFRGALSGALGGALVGGAGGALGANLAGKADFKKLQLQRKALEQANARSTRKVIGVGDAGVTKAQQKMIDVAHKKNYQAYQKNTKGLVSGTYVPVGGALGGLAGGYIGSSVSGADEKPWYQRMNPFG
jgi:hypothetical protein